MAVAMLQNVEHEFDKRILLNGVSLEISQGERVALVGANGCGKTTLFRILARDLAPTRGEAVWSRGLRLAMLDQHPRLPAEKTVREVARQAFGELMDVEQRMRDLSAEMATASGEQLGQLMKQYDRLEAQHAAAGGFSWEHRVEEVLAGVGFEPAQRDLPCGVLSGGQQCRVALASVLLSGADLLLLDEPTNHLDLDGVQWLEKWLDKAPASVLLISHDRYLLDRVVSKVYELRDGLVEMYPGNYSNYVQQREIRALERQRQFEKDQAYIAKERDFIARFHASGSRSREARGRATRLERRLKAGEFRTDVDGPDHTISLKIKAAERGSEMAARLAGVSKAFDQTRIVQDLTLDLRWGQKLAILGPNGVGKTTVLRMMMGEEPCDSGTIRIGKGMRVGYYDQQQRGLNDNLTALEQMQAFLPLETEESLRSFLARFLFRGEDVFKRVAMLSGGERSRLLLARLLYERPNFLVLDEPTNHLDIASCEVLEAALAEYDGTVALVSHDRYFVDRTCNRLLMLRPDGWEVVEGNFSFWRLREEERAERRRAEQAAAEAEAAARKIAGKGRPTGAGKAEDATSRVGGFNTYQLAKLTLEDVEEKIHQAERELLETELSFSDPKVFESAEKLAALQQTYDDIKARIDQLMEAWQIKMEEAEMEE